MLYDITLSGRALQSLCLYISECSTWMNDCVECSAENVCTNCKSPKVLDGTNCKGISSVVTSRRINPMD